MKYRIQRGFGSTEGWCVFEGGHWTWVFDSFEQARRYVSARLIPAQEMDLANWGLIPFGNSTIQ